MTDELDAERDQLEAGCVNLHRHRVTANDAAQRAYGILWRDPSMSMFSRAARSELFMALSYEERRAGIAWAIEMFGPMTESEMIAADIRVGVFPQKSTDALKPK